MSPPPIHLAMAGFAVLALYPRFQGPREEDRRLPFGTRLTYYVEDGERFYYRGAFADCVRGVDFLATRPEIVAGRARDDDLEPGHVREHRLRRL